MIKALACHMGRNVVNVPLGRIETNQAGASCCMSVGSELTLIRVAEVIRIQILASQMLVNCKRVLGR